MTESDSTTGVRQLFDVAGDLEGNQDALRILLDLTNSIACDWSRTDSTEAVGKLIERVILLTNAALQKIDDLDGLVQLVYQHGKSNRLITTE